MSRADFTMDSLFGMPGVPAGAGALQVVDQGLPTEHFSHPHSEATYQVWLRGYNSKALAVRDALKQELDRHSIDMTDDGAFDDSYNDVLKELLHDWWSAGLISKRPGD